MKKTALDWYEKEIDSLLKRYETKEISNLDFIVMKHNVFYQAKQMEKQQIKEAYTEGCYTESWTLRSGEEYHGEEYYKETYGEE